ncbi:MAG: cation diffusion facilitator family transporter [Chloroflexota bacterium]
MSYSGSRAAKLSLAVVIGLICLKVAVGIITGSLSIIAQAADSLLDLFAVTITFFAIRIATKPADWEHPFGHGKAENIAAIAQALLIFAAGGSIIYSAIQRIINGTNVSLAEAGIAAMLVSIIASILLSRYLLRVSQAIDSVALQANAHNIATDVYSAAAVLAGLLVVRLTGIEIIDPIIALVVALFILKVAYDVLRKAFGGLIDVKLPEEEENAIKSSITEHFGELVNFHKLRTRKAGNQRYIDLHVVMPKSLSIAEAHRLCDHLEQDIGSRLRHASVTIHVEPCDDECQQCPITCDSRKTG